MIRTRLVSMFRSRKAIVFSDTLMALILSSVVVGMIFIGIFLSWTNIACYVGINWVYTPPVPNMGSALGSRVLLEVSEPIIETESKCTESCDDQYDSSAVPSQDKFTQQLCSSFLSSCISIQTSQCIADREDEDECIPSARTFCSAKYTISDLTKCRENIISDFNDMKSACIENCETAHPEEDEYVSFEIKVTYLGASPSKVSITALETGMSEETVIDMSKCMSALMPGTFPGDRFSEGIGSGGTGTGNTIPGTEIVIPGSVSIINNLYLCGVKQCTPVTSPMWYHETGAQMNYMQTLTFTTERRLIDRSLKCGQTQAGCDITFTAAVTSDNNNQRVTGVLPGIVTFKAKDLGFCTTVPVKDVNVSVSGFEREGKKLSANVSITGADVYDECPSATIGFTSFTDKGIPVSIIECSEQVSTKQASWIENEASEYKYKFTISVNNTFADQTNASINATVYFDQNHLQLRGVKEEIPHNMTSCSEVVITRKGDTKQLPLYVTNEVKKTNSWGKDVCVQADLIFADPAADATALFSKNKIREYDVYFVKGAGLPEPLNRIGDVAPYFPYTVWESVESQKLNVDSHSNVTINSSVGGGTSIILGYGTCP